MDHIENMLNRYPELASCEESVRLAVSAVVDCYSRGGKILLAGNGGSAADCEHISGELLKGFLSKRPVSESERELLSRELSEDAVNKLQRGISAVPLTSLSAVLSAFANDVDAELVFAQLVFALAKPADLVIGLSTSGNSKNVVEAVRVARAIGVKTLALTGEGGGDLGELADIAIRVPETETYKVQEYHLPVYHAICAEAERLLFG